MIRTRPSLWLLVGALVLVALAVPLLVPDDGRAQTPPFTVACHEPPPDMGGTVDDAIETREQRQEQAQDCAALVERLEAIYFLQLDAIESETTASAQRVALAPVDRNRLDLTWMGVWAMVGVSFGLLVAPMMQRAFRWWQE